MKKIFIIALQQIQVAIVLLLMMTLLTGIIYPFLVTGIMQLFFQRQANGSLVEKNGEPIGSALIGQSFSNNGYFWGRPSATTPYPYNATNSSGSNMGPSNPAFINAVKNRVAQWQSTTDTVRKVPVDLVTASGSGLDPEMSVLAALYQVNRVANARHLDEIEVKNLVLRLAKKRTLGILGEPRVNVLELNLALDNLRTNNASQTPKP